MGRRARSEITRQIQGQSWDGAAGLLAAALIAAILALAISASSALAVTGGPELIAPTGKPTEAGASFKLGSAAKKLLATHGASVKLAVRAYAPASAGGKVLASVTLPGRP